MWLADLQYFSRRGGGANGVLRIVEPFYSFKAGDRFIMVHVPNSAVEVTLPDVSSLPFGDTVSVKDIAGTALTHNILIKTVSPLQKIDGQDTFTLKWNYSGAEFITDGYNWFLSP